MVARVEELGAMVKTVLRAIETAVFLPLIKTAGKLLFCNHWVVHLAGRPKNRAVLAQGGLAAMLYILHILQ
ncbi:hypothetical protein ACZ75_10380 [Massilia sp. NR 4-1]|nr:hypothetical protein ACZ75_10380 [Massilia sp. NR 4-1]